jgi:aldehyde dehydrogenase (NAD(P)+)
MTDLTVDAAPAWKTQIDATLARLHRGEAIWAGTPLARRRELLEQMHVLVGRNAQAWVNAATGVKGLDPGSTLVGEEWLSGPYAMLTTLAVLAETVAALEKGDSPVDGYRIRSAPGGRVAVEVLPPHRVRPAAAQRLVGRGLDATRRLGRPYVPRPG